MEPIYQYRARVVTVLDADSLRLEVQLGFRCTITIDGRIRGINAPENNTPEGKAATAYVRQLLADHPDQLVIRSWRDRRSFARWVIDAYLGDFDMADLIVDAGHAVRV